MERSAVPDKYNKIVWKTTLIGVPVNGSLINVHKNDVSFLTDDELNVVLNSNGCDNDSSVFINERYACAECLYEYSKHAWYRHKQLHTKEGEYKCKKCGLSFDTKRGIELHWKSCKGRKRIALNRGVK